MQVKTHKLKACLAMRAAFIVLCALCFVMPATAQTNKVYMHDGSRTLVGDEKINFYDSGGQSSGPSYYWERWFQRNEDYTFTFKPESGKKIKVTFKHFTAYTDNNGASDPHPFLVHDQWALRLNTAELSIYDGEDTDPANSTLITTYTGGVINEFSIIANGAMTFHFQSYGYREEGWQAEVEQVSAYTLMPPAISFEACTDNVVINANNKDAQIYYQLNNEPDPEDPLEGAIEYEGPFAVEVGDIVYAIVKVENNYSTAASLQFASEDVTPTPGQPTITRDVNTITMTPAPIVGDINETYEVWYTTATGENPTYVQYEEPFEWTLPNTTFRAVTRAQTCSDKQSEPFSFSFVKVQVPDPTITFTVTNEETGEGTVTISCAEGYVLSYTDDGTVPTASSGTTNTVTITGVTPGTTYSAIAYKSDGEGGEDPNYQQSNVVTVICIPGGDGNSGVFGSIVLLDDREEHSWIYYSVGGTTNPIHCLNPADVKISYFGNGITMKTDDDYTANTSSNDYETSTGVAVGMDASANQFVYLKTLENADKDGTGDYPYTMIPNPFSKRPVYGDGNTRWRGFQGWRVKRLSSDLSITDGTNSYGVGAIIPAETEISFVTDKENGNEVDFEAVWARAYVNTSNSATGLDGGSYERNFIVGAAPSAALNVPVTYSRYYPDGTGGTNTVNIGTFTCSADTKFEYMNLNSGTLTANNHDLIMGRGLTGTATLLQGINGGMTDLDYTIRVESGKYSQLSFVRSSNCTVSGRYHIKSIMGSDYDRANVSAENPNGDNSKLSVSQSNNLFFSTAVTFSNASNRNEKTFDLVVKSGEYQKDYWYNQATAPTNSNNPQGGGWQSSFYCGQNQGTNNYQGIRYVVVEGGEFGCMNGGRGTNGTSATYDPDNNVPVVTLRIKGGLFHGAIYGGAADSETRGNRAIIITGGEIQSWVAGANNGTGTQSGSSAAVVADAYVYVGGDAIIGGDNANAVNITNGGQVFGAGRGKSDQRASVVNSYVVIADDATISNNNNTSTYPVGGNVYGGGNYGYVTTVSNVYILGGTIQRHVFGGAYGNNYVIPTSNVYVQGGTVNGSVYGGSNSNGTVGTEGVHLATVNMSGGETTNVFGGGLGESTNMANGTIVNVSGGLINNNVYGGGEEGTVNGDTHVNVSGGTMKDVFGAGKGSNTSTAQVSGHTYVNVTGGTVTNVYGGGEKGDVMGDDTPAQTQTKVLTVTLYGNHNQQNQNNRDRLRLYVNNQSIFDQRWPQTNPQGGSTSYTVTVTCDVEITARFTRGSSGNANNISFSITEGSTTYMQENRPNQSQYYDPFIVPSDPVSGDADVRSFVTIDGGDVGGDVFGGGKMGKTGGSTQVNIENGFVRGDVFGGAYGEAGSVFVAGMHTVNVMGGRVFGSVYGGSRNAHDALVFTGYNLQEKATNAVVNISGGQVDLQVYAAGYYGKTFGSVFAFVGKNAILNAPHCQPSFGDDNEEKYKTTTLRLEHNVWAGGDWGVFTSGSFGAPTVSGYSSIYVDGEGYNTETSNQSTPAYMNIAGSLFGCGTSCDAGTQGRMIMVRNYGHAKAGNRNENFPEPYSEATRTLYAIQRADTLIIDNSNINFTGHARINSLEATAKYAIYSFDKTVRIVNGTGLFLNTPVTQIFDFWNASCPDVYVYGATYTPIEYNGVDACENKIRVNGGNYIEVYHDKMINGSTPGYGMLNGFAYMMVAQSTSDNTCAYARPKQCTETPIDNSWDNPYDGGWVSYDPDKNTFTIGTYANGAWSSIPTLVALGNSDQMPYENHVNSSKAGEEHFRIWRAGGKYSEREAVVNITADGSSTFGYVDVYVNLPAWRTEGSYYAFETVGEGANLNTTVNYGAEVMMFNSAMLDDETWIHFNEQTKKQEFGPSNQAQQQIISNPNVNFGMVAMPGEAMGIVTPQIGGQNVPGVIVCNEADAFLASVTGTAPNYQTVNRFPCTDFETNPQVKFRLTYHNTINTNMTWEPMFVTLVQCDENGNIKDIVRIIITINTFTTLDREFVTQAYAIMNETGGPSETYVTKLVLPTFDIYDVTAEHLSIFTLQSVTFEPETGNDATQDSWIKRGGEMINGSWQTYDLSHFAMEITPSLNMDNSDGWDESFGIKDSKMTIPAGGVPLGETGGREPFAFDFVLTYNGSVLFEGAKPRLGMLTFTITYDNVRIPTVDNNGNPVLDPDGNPTYHEGTKTLIIKVDVIRRGRGTVFYLDGQNGSNANDARHPDKAALTLSTIFNRCGFLPGDIIYIVNEVDIDNYLVWSGTRYNGVTIYRYPGGHPLSQTQQYDENGNPWYTDGHGHYSLEQLEGYYPWIVEGEIVDNPDNEAYTGTLVDVENGGELIIRDIRLDGHDDDHTSPVPTETGTDAEVTSNSPLINVSSGGTLTLTTGSVLRENTNTEDGGAVVVNSGATLIMNDNATINNNVTSGNGGAVYMAGTMIVSGSVQVAQNHSGESLNNVYLYTSTDPEVFGNVVQIGTHDPDDEYGPITEEAHIGITKALTEDIDDWPEGIFDGYTKILYVENEEDIAWLDIPFNSRPNAIVFDDGGRYQLERFDDPQYLYWIETWVTVQYHVPTEAEGGWNENGNTININTKYQLAWLISLVNGENGQTANTFEGKTININKDLNMVEHTWVPIGTSEHPFLGTFEGNGHIVDNVRSILMRDDAGMFGVTNNATIEDMVVYAHLNGNSVNKGTLIGTMNGGMLANVEAAGYLIGRDNSRIENMGGLVGLVTPNTNTLIHSGFAVNDITVPTATTVVGGLVGNNGGDLYNSYANVTLTEGEGIEVTTKGGLVGINKADCTVENCYVINPIGAAFADQNSGTIIYCYAAEGTDDDDYVESGVDAVNHGTYGPVLGRKELGYMYGDNVTTLVGEENPYIAQNLTYKNIGDEDADFGVIDRWPGLLSTLNQWVKVKNTTSTDPLFGKNFTTWSRSTSSYLENDVVKAYINGDLPVLDFPKDNCFGTIDGRFLRYSATAYDENFANDNNNGIDALLDIYNDKEDVSYLYLYNNATKVANIPDEDGHVFVFINEKVVLIQDYEDEGSKDGEDENNANFRAVVGVTFENSHGTAGNMATPNCSEDPLDLLYDWHMMSSPLKAAPMGTTYNMNAVMEFGKPANITDMVGNYLPDGLTMTTPAPDGEVKWDLYSFYEPHYHWINLKRSTGNHWHYDINGAYPCDHDPIPYINEEVFEPAKGYMMAIDSVSYLSNSGKLNNGKVEIPLTYDCLYDIEERGCNLIGNPFHAYLDMEKFLNKNEGFDKYYVYSAEWNAYVGSNAEASENPALPSRTLAPFQAFFVKVAAKGNKAVFNNGMTTTKPDAYSQFRSEKVNYPLVNLFVTDDDGMRDLSVIEFNRPEEGGTEKLRVMKNTNFELYARMNDQDYSILFTKEGTQRVPVWFKTRENGVYTMTWNTYYGNFSSLRLIDNITGVNYDMLANDSYTFEASADDYASRFYITFTCTGVDEEITEESGDNFAFFDGSEWVINGKGQLEVIDMTGRILYTEKLTNDQNRVYLNYAPGVYMIRVIDNKNMKTQKVVVR